jgi:hypothetical protein
MKPSMLQRLQYGQRYALAALALVLCSTPALFAQGVLPAPPDGNNQRAVVTQYVGLVSITVDYHSPNVVSPRGEDRSGKIWGKLVPWGVSDLGFGPGGLKPWRAGANENTSFTVSHDVMIEGQKLPAGSYGLHIIPDSAKEWTVIFSKNSTAWGSYFYKESEDALRVNVKPQSAEYHQWLTYEFVERKPNATTVALFWDRLKLPLRIEVPNLVDYYIAAMRKALQHEVGFTWQPWQQAANYCLTNNTNLQEALEWAEYSIAAPFVGEKNFSTLSTKARILAQLGKAKEGDELMKQALPLGTMQELHGYGRQLLSQKKPQDALEVFLMNAKKNPDVFTTNMGLMRGYSATGDYKKALNYAKQALKQAPDPQNKAAVEEAIKKLESGKDANS